MKTLKLIALFAMFIPLVLNAAGPVGTYNEDGEVAIADTTGRNILSIRPSRDNTDGFSLSISGYEINFGPGVPGETPQFKGFNRRNDSHRSNFLDQSNGYARKKYRTPISVIELGFSGVADGSYKIDIPYGNGYMKPNIARSIHIQWNLLRFSESLNANRDMGLSSAIGLAWDRYVFDNFVYDGNRSVPRPPGRGVKRSSISTFSLHVPLMLGYSNEKFQVGGGVYGNFLINRSQKIDYYTFRNNLRMNVDSHAGVTFRVGIKGVSLFVNYGFMSVFSGDANRAQPITFGVGFF